MGYSENENWTHDLWAKLLTKIEANGAINLYSNICHCWTWRDFVLRWGCFGQPFSPKIFNMKKMIFMLQQRNYFLKFTDESKIDLWTQRKKDFFPPLLPFCLAGIKNYLLVILLVKKFESKLVNSVRYSVGKKDVVSKGKKWSRVVEK